MSTTLKVTQSRVLLSEWTKLRSLRSTLWTLLVAVVLTIGLGALISAVTAANFDKFGEQDRATFDAISTSLAGTAFAQLAIGVLGVLLISAEYSTGMIRSSMTVVPRRLPVLWGKVIVFAVVAYVVMLVAALIAFVLGQSLLSSKNLNVSLGDDGTLRGIFGVAFYVTVVGLIGVALGALLRNTAGAITSVVALVFVLPPILQILPSSWTEHFVQYLPTDAGDSLWSTGSASHALSPWGGFFWLIGWVVVFLALAALRLMRSDV